MSDLDGDDGVDRDAIEEQAIAWFMNLRAREPGADTSDLDAWLDQSADHRRAYERARYHFEASEILKSSVRHGKKKPLHSRTFFLGLGIAAALALAIALGATFTSNQHLRTAINEEAAPARMRAPRHQIRAVALADGSDLTLDAASQIEVAMTSRERRIRLLEGKARIAVSADPRPFIVEAGSGELMANAASFDVDMAADGQIEVAVLSGEVELRRLLRPAVLERVAPKMQAGQSYGYLASDFTPIAVGQDDTDRRDWPNGWTEYHSAPLSEVIADANRYARQPIELDEPPLGNLLVSGRFHITDSDRFAERIASLFGLAAVHRQGAIHLRKR